CPLSICLSLFSTSRRPPTSSLFPYTTLFRSWPRCRPWYGPPEDRVYTFKPDFAYGIRVFAGDAPQPNCAVVDYGRDCWGCFRIRSEEHTSELQSRFDLVCRLLLEKKKKTQQM